MTDKDKILFDMLLDLQSKVDVLCEYLAEGDLETMNEAIRKSRIVCLEQLLSRFPDTDIKIFDSKGNNNQDI